MSPREKKFEDKAKKDAEKAARKKAADGS